jgi:hypothetical protein
MAKGLIRRAHWNHAFADNVLLVCGLKETAQCLVIGAENVLFAMAKRQIRRAHSYCALTENECVT